MTFEKIISDLYVSVELDRCIVKMVKAADREDFKQELFLILSTQSEELIQRLYQTGKLRFYVVRVIINLSRSKEHVYNKKYNDRRVVYDTDKVSSYVHPAENGEIEIRIAREERELRLCHEVQNNLEAHFGTWYYKALIDLINKHGSMRAVSRLTGINPCSIYRSVKKVREHLQSI